MFENENCIFYLNIINQRIKKLNEIEKLKKNNNNLENVISSLKPPVFWKDKMNILEQSKRWGKEKLIIALEKIYKTEIYLKSNVSIRKDLILKKLILDLCIEANAT